jgi:hypothetical protein
MPDWRVPIFFFSVTRGGLTLKIRAPKDRELSVLGTSVRRVGCSSPGCLASDMIFATTLSGM